MWILGWPIVTSYLDRDSMSQYWVQLEMDSLRVDKLDYIFSLSSLMCTSIVPKILWWLKYLPNLWVFNNTEQLLQTSCDAFTTESLFLCPWNSKSACSLFSIVVFIHPCVCPITWGFSTEVITGPTAELCNHHLPMWSPAKEGFWTSFSDYSDIHLIMNITLELCLDSSLKNICSPFCFPKDIGQHFWRYFLLSQLRWCYCYLLGGGQGCHKKTYHALNIPHNTNYPVQKKSVLKWCEMRGSFFF